MFPFIKKLTAYSDSPPTVASDSTKPYDNSQFYTMVFIPEGDSWMVFATEFSYVSAHGKTKGEAAKNLMDRMDMILNMKK